MAKGADVDLKKLSDEELEQYGFDLDRERGEQEQKFRELQLKQQAEVTRRSDARGGASRKCIGRREALGGAEQ